MSQFYFFLAGFSFGMLGLCWFGARISRILDPGKPTGWLAPTTLLAVSGVAATALGFLSA